MLHWGHNTTQCEYLTKLEIVKISGVTTQCRYLLKFSLLRNSPVKKSILRGSYPLWNNLPSSYFFLYFNYFKLREDSHIELW